MPGVSRTPVRTRQELAVAKTISTADYAALYDISVPTVLKGVAEGTIPAIRVGRTIRIPAAHVRAELGVEEGEW